MLNKRMTTKLGKKGVEHQHWGFPAKATLSFGGIKLLRMRKRRKKGGEWKNFVGKAAARVERTMSRQKNKLEMFDKRLG